MRRRNRSGRRPGHPRPSTRTRPSLGSISRLISRSSVVLPEPEGPTMARNSCSFTSSVTPVENPAAAVAVALADERNLIAAAGWLIGVTPGLSAAHERTLRRYLGVHSPASPSADPEGRSKTSSPQMWCDIAMTQILRFYAIRPGARRIVGHFLRHRRICDATLRSSVEEPLGRRHVRCPSEPLANRPTRRPALPALVLLLLTEYYEFAYIAGFLLAWGILNFIWLAVLRRPAVSAMLSLAMIGVLIAYYRNTSTAFLGTPPISWT